MPQTNPTGEEKELIGMLRDVHNQIQTGFILQPTRLLTEVQGDGSNVKEQALTTMTTMVTQLSAAKKQAETLWSYFAPGEQVAASNDAKDRDSLIIDSIPTALQTCVDNGADALQQMYLAVVPTWPPREMLNYRALCGTLLGAIRDMTITAALVIAHLESE